MAPSSLSDLTRRSMQTGFFSSVRYAQLDQQRRMGKAPPTVPLDPDDPEQSKHLGTHQPAVLRSDAALVTTLLAQLPAEQQSLIRMHDLEKLTLDQMAERTSVNRNTLHYRYTKAVQALATLIRNADKPQRALRP